jgi:hypothetical protein
MFFLVSFPIFVSSNVMTDFGIKVTLHISNFPFLKMPFEITELYQLHRVVVAGVSFFWLVDKLTRTQEFGVTANSEEEAWRKLLSNCGFLVPQPVGHHVSDRQ